MEQPKEAVRVVNELLEDLSLKKQVTELRALYRSARRMAKAEDLDVLLNDLAEDLAGATNLERIVVIYYDAASKRLEPRVFYGYEAPGDVDSIPFEVVNGLLKKVYADREPLHVVDAEGANGSGQVLCGIYRDYYNLGADTVNRRQTINLCIKNLRRSKLDLPRRAGELRCSLMTLEAHDKSIESLLGDSSSYLILPITEGDAFYGYLLADKGHSGRPVSYSEARLAAAMVTHAASAIGRAVRQKRMLERIAEQHQELKRAHERLSHHLDEIEHLKSFYESIIQNLRSGLITFDEHLMISHVNRAAEEILGYEPGELLGKSIRVILPEAQAAMRCVFRDEVDQTRTAGSCPKGCSSGRTGMRSPPSPVFRS